MKTYKPGDHWNLALHKYDGVRLHITGRAAITRTGKSDRSHVIEWFMANAGIRPADHEIHAELFVPGHTATEVSRAVANGDFDRLQIVAFAVPLLTSWRHAVEYLTVHGYSTPAEYVGHTTDELLKTARTVGFEGYVLINTDNHTHQPRKLKVTNTMDCRVVGYNISDSETKCGALKNLVVEDADGIRVANVGGGFSDDERWMFDWDEWKGKIIEVEYDDIAAKGRLKHPRFVRVRDDKTEPDRIGDHTK